ncbi:MAG: DUF6323 family protein [Christensenella sp.]|nr:DUF6323 family protein [Christensenella sp.]
MEHHFMAGQTPSERQRFFAELAALNAVSARFGLTLSAQGMEEIRLSRMHALLNHGRIELGSSAVPAIVDGFCDSPFLLQEEYEATLMELVDAFYYFKNACAEQLTDDELIQAMRERYDAYDGSIEAVTGTTLEALCRARRLGEAYDDGRLEEEYDDD